VSHLVGLQDGFRAMGFEGDSQDAIAVIIVNDEDIVVSSTGWCHKLAGEVHVGLAGGFHHGGIAEMSVVTVVNGWGEGIGIGDASSDVVGAGVVGACLMEWRFLRV